MTYKTGDKIPGQDILRRLLDEDGFVYLELKGEKNQLFRVGEGNSLFFRVDKTEELMNRLKVVEDFRGVEDYVEKVKEEADPEIEPSDEITLKIDAENIQKKLAEMSFNEGDKIPDGLKSQCTRNAYGGYSLEYNNFSYVLDTDFRVEMRRPVTSGDLTLEAEDLVTASQKKEFVREPEIKGDITLNKGDLLPENLRSECEVDLSEGGGFRIEIGNSLYILDENYRVVVKMSQSLQNGEEPSIEVRLDEKEGRTTDDRHPPGKIVDSVLKKFQIALKVDKINADLFIKETLVPGKRNLFLNVYHGDLSELNEDTRAAAETGKVTKISEGGISLLKAALIHELYLKSTYRGRGEQMIEFLTHIISPWKDAALTITQKDLSGTEQQRLIDFVNRQSGVYQDIGEVLHQIYMEMKVNIQDEYKRVQKEGRTLFKAFLIDRLYEKISRPDKGDGISLICLSRDIMDFQF